MSIPQSAGGPIETRDDLIRHLAAGCKPKIEWRIGTEHEKFVYDLKTHKPLAYDAKPGIRQLLEGMQQFGWEPVLEGPNIIGLTQDGASLSLEPGGQFELSGAPLKTVHETCSEVNLHLEQTRTVADNIGAGVIGIGFAPTWSMDETHQMPKGRYQIMRRYMPKVGGYGLEMMFRTCTVQVNLDFSSEADMVKKLRVGLALQPIATAIFANSPFTEGRPNGFQSYRAEIWRDTDPNRTGLLPFAFEQGMGFERYVDYALDVPMYFVYRDDRYINVAGASFRDFLAGKLVALPGERPTLDDWRDHLTTLFPDVRLKRFLEMRGADSGSLPALVALPALWVGLLYDDDTLDAAYALIADWTLQERQALRDSVPRLGLATPFRKRGVLDLAREIVSLAETGLKRRKRLDPNGADESKALEPLFGILEQGRSPADLLLADYAGGWKGNIDKVFDARAL